MTASTPHNLLAVAKAFAGREADLDALAALVDTHRVAHLTGPPGIGKTELARALGHRAVAEELFPGGVFHISLDGATRIATLTGDLVFHLGIDETLPLERALEGPSRLVIWDQLDDVLSHAPDLARRFFAEDTAAADAVHHLLVHRAPAEAEPSLVLGPLDAAGAFAAFVGQLPPTVSAVPARDDRPLAEALERLGGNPLAIRLASRWCRPPRWTNVLAEGLDATAAAVPAGLEGPMATGLGLALADLDEPARRLLGMLAALPAGAGEGTLHAMFGEDWDKPAADLERTGLVDTMGERHILLSAVRAVAPAVLGARQARTLWDQAAFYLQQVLTEWKVRMEAGNADQSQRFVTREWENLRATFNWALDGLERPGVDQEEDARLAMDCATAMFHFMYGHRMYREGLAWMEACLPLAERFQDPTAAAVLADFVGLFRVRLGRPEAAREAFERSLAGYREVNSLLGVGSTAYHLGLLLYEGGDTQAARPHFEEALDELRASKARSFAAQAATYLGLIQLGAGEAETAFETLTDALSLYEEKTQDPELRLRARFGLAEAAARTGRADESLAEACTALEHLFRSHPRVLTAGTPQVLRLVQVYLETADRTLLVPYAGEVAAWTERMRMGKPHPKVAREWRIVCDAMDRVSGLIGLVGTAFGPDAATAPAGADARAALPEAARDLDSVSGGLLGAERWVRDLLAAG